VAATASGEASKELRKRPGKKAAKTKRSKKRKKNSARSAQENKRGRGGAPRSFPGSTFESVLPLARVIFENAGAAREMRRETVFEKLNKAANSSSSRLLVTNSGRYGLTIGSYVAEALK